MIKEKDLNYWKTNAEEDYKQVPISVLRYITELETAVKKCCISVVVLSDCDYGHNTLNKNEKPCKLMCCVKKEDYEQ